jgi:hypothetical protein
MGASVDQTYTDVADGIDNESTMTALFYHVCCERHARQETTREDCENYKRCQYSGFDRIKVEQKRTPLSDKVLSIGI